MDSIFKNSSKSTKSDVGGHRPRRRDSFTVSKAAAERLLARSEPGGRISVDGSDCSVGAAARSTSDYGDVDGRIGVAAERRGAIERRIPRIGFPKFSGATHAKEEQAAPSDNATDRPAEPRPTYKAANLLYGMANGDAAHDANHSKADASSLEQQQRAHAPPVRRVSFLNNSEKADKAAKAARVLGLDSTVGVGGVGLPTTSEISECSAGADGGIVRSTRFTLAESFGSSGCDDEGSVVTSGSVDASSGTRKKRRVFRRMVSSIRRPFDDLRISTPIPPLAAMVHFPPKVEETENQRGRQARGSFISKQWNKPPSGTRDPLSQSAHSDPAANRGAIAGSRRMSIPPRRTDVDGKLHMGLDHASADYLDYIADVKCQDWLKSLSRRDPRACIKGFFDDVARDGADSIEEPNGFQPELLSPLLSMFQRSSVFSVWRPTSMISIRKMMKGEGTGKGLDIKGKSAKKGKLSAYIPFLQIHENEHRKKIRLLPRDERIRIFYKKQKARDQAHRILLDVMANMTGEADAALASLLRSGKVSGETIAQDECRVGHVLRTFRAVEMKGLVSDEEQEKINIIDQWSMDNPTVVAIDDYTPKCYGLDLPKRLFWEGYVMRAKDISRGPGSTYDTGRPSQPSFQDYNFSSIKNKCEKDSPRAVVWQYTDPYLPPSEPDPDPMMPQTLLMAYEEYGRVTPVVSDFDCFLLGTRGVRFHTPLPADQVKVMHGMIGDIEKILKDCREGKTNNWMSAWLNVMKRRPKQHMPRYGFGDPKSYAIMKYAVQTLKESGAVRHGAECFNFYFPQELDDEFLVIGGNLGGPKYKYMKLNELQDFLSSTIDLGFTFPLNPKWVLCDKGWKDLWDKLTGSTHPNVQLSIDAWYPPGSGLKERIEEIGQRNPEGFQSDLSGRKKGTQAWDEAEIALDRYQRIQRAKRKLWTVLCWISIVQQSRKTVLARYREEGGIELDATGAEVDENGFSSVRRVSFHEFMLKLSSKKLVTAESEDITAPPIIDEIANTGERNNTSLIPVDSGIANMGECNTTSLIRSHSHSTSEVSRYRSTSSLMSEGEEENLEVIDSLLGSNLPLLDHQTAGLQRIREQLVIRSIPRTNNRFERRHTSIDGCSSSLMLEDVPSFILKEYGGAKGSARDLFKKQVKKIMNAQIFINSTTRKACEGPQNGIDHHFLPVEWTSLSKQSKQNLVPKLSFVALARWDYNMIEVAKLCNGSPLLLIGWAIIGSPHAQQAMAQDLGMFVETETLGYSFITELSVQIPILCSFLRTVEADYLLNPYHNNTHAADVVQTLNTMLQLGGKSYASSPLDIFSILVAAVIHDVKHPGLNNNFQVNSRSELAVQYNDVSVLENYSITWLFSKLLGQTRDFTVDIFSGLSNEQFSKARSIIIRSVLETDMSHHFALLKRMGIHQEMLKGKDAVDWLQTYTKQGVNYDPSMDMLCFLLHQADISNPAKPYPLFVEWADSILSESYAQGDKEASLSLPVSPLCDRVTTNKKQSQIGFIKFVVRPSYQLLGEIIPLFAETVFPHIENSLEFWDDFEEDTDFDVNNQ